MEEEASTRARASTSANHCPLPGQVSTALTLCDPTWNYNTNQRKAEELDLAPLTFSAFPPNPKHKKIEYESYEQGIKEKEKEPSCAGNYAESTASGSGALETAGRS
ncbi:hypothetical protein L3X38_028350 [Prunus dulcis]|uniref:Uncharacterized protein n=1 Tax=Prunus dulcis TaxID=3755 RepID=A0AAD4VPU3_PRUDU|nr:hypothetical protein L3X38_028350 [Prunus dulcis]